MENKYELIDCSIQTNRIDETVAQLPIETTVVYVLFIEGPFAFVPSCFGSISNIKSCPYFDKNSVKQVTQGPSVGKREQQSGGIVK
jgi:hypothetical protein